MASKQNTHKVYKTTETGYLFRLRPTEEQVNVFIEAQKKIRECLKQALSESYGTQPKFRVQGSWAYGTCNQPAQDNQEMDLDYGAYLPASVFSSERSSEEAISYYKVAKLALSKLCEDFGWGLDASKVTCLRINRIMRNAHIDIPLYAVPDKMFDELQENHSIVLEKSQRSDAIYSNYSMEAYDSVIFAEAASIDLQNIEMIHMAKQDGEWKASDCEKVRDWFQRECLKYPNKGVQLRSVIRYLKGWRDHQWDVGGPTSILLMVIAVQNYKYLESRDDLAILNVAERLSFDLGRDIYEPGIEGHDKENFNRSDDKQRQENAQKAHQLYQRLQQAINSQHRQLSIDLLINVFGSRIPNDFNLVVTESHDEKLNPFAAVLAEPARIASESDIIKPQIGG
jgi:hypothetical protein